MSKPISTPTAGFLRSRVEWPTLGLALATYLLWGAAVFGLSQLSVGLAAAVIALTAALHSSLCHEAIHGHPFGSEWMNAALMFPALALAIPYLRFRDTHLAHHQDEHLTDPYDDPESNFLDPATWARLPKAVQALLWVNNTLAGRMLIGPALGLSIWCVNDLRAVLRGDRRILLAWVLHVPAAGLVLWLVALSPMPVWAYVLAAYGALSLLKIRTFLEHQAHHKARARTVIIEDRGLLAFLFLNNNLHVVHHMHPKVPWYRLPALFHEHREHYLRRNEAYRYASYREVFRLHLLKKKDPIAHPLWSRRG